jgi:ABC-type branched-subunit amino acid transport system permease subunit
MIILAVVMGGVALVMKGTVGRYLAAIRGSQTAAASLGISLTRAKITVFALSAGIAGLGGALYASTQTQVGAGDFGYEFSLVWVVAVITTGAMTLEGAIQAGMGLAVFQQILNLYVPARFTGIEFVLFAVGTLTYAQHPEGIVEYQKTRWMNRIAKLFQRYDERRGRATPGTTVSTPGSTTTAQLVGPGASAAQLAAPGAPGA